MNERWRGREEGWRRTTEQILPFFSKQSQRRTHIGYKKNTTVLYSYTQQVLYPKSKVINDDRLPYYTIGVIPFTRREESVVEKKGRRRGELPIYSHFSVLSSFHSYSLFSLFLGCFNFIGETTPPLLLLFKNSSNSNGVMLCRDNSNEQQTMQRKQQTCDDQKTTLARCLLLLYIYNSLKSFCIGGGVLIIILLLLFFSFFFFFSSQSPHK